MVLGPWGDRGLVGEVGPVEIVIPCPPEAVPSELLGELLVEIDSARGERIGDARHAQAVAPPKWLVRRVRPDLHSPGDRALHEDFSRRIRCLGDPEQPLRQRPVKAPMNGEGEIAIRHDEVPGTIRRGLRGVDEVARGSRGRRRGE